MPKAREEGPQPRGPQLRGPPAALIKVQPLPCRTDSTVENAGPIITRPQCIRDICYCCQGPPLCKAEQSSASYICKGQETGLRYADIRRPLCRIGPAGICSGHPKSREGAQRDSPDEDRLLLDRLYRRDQRRCSRSKVFKVSVPCRSLPTPRLTLILPRAQL